jgi:hypothetical protein
MNCWQKESFARKTEYLLSLKYICGPVQFIFQEKVNKLIKAARQFLRSDRFDKKQESHDDVIFRF